MEKNEKIKTRRKRKRKENQKPKKIIKTNIKKENN
jgi:hypothetical protein